MLSAGSYGVCDISVYLKFYAPLSQLNGAYAIVIYYKISTPDGENIKMFSSIS